MHVYITIIIKEEIINLGESTVVGKKKSDGQEWGRCSAGIWSSQKKVLNKRGSEKKIRGKNESVTYTLLESMHLFYNGTYFLTNSTHVKIID